jgi:hypothetical protein
LTAPAAPASATHRAARGARGVDRRAFGRAALACVLASLVGPVRADAVELLALDVVRRDGEVSVDFAVRVTLPAPVEDALRRGIVLHFEAQAELVRPRWYWRDMRVGRVRREWRLSYQPLTGSFRVSTGGLHQTFASLDEAMATMTRLTRWRVADADDVDPDARHVLDFAWRLDTGELPRPMQIGIGNLPEWQLAVERRVELRR